MRSIKFALIAAASLVAVGSAHAQAPAPVTVKDMSMGLAMAIIQGTIEQCTKDG
jgi:hypothetical protein